jgi:hypothetical protein
MKKQKQKKKNKKYTKKYYTGGRVDYRKGGRVQKAKGGVNTRPAEPDDVLDKINKPNRPIAEPIRKPIAQKPQKPIQPGIPVTGGGDLGSGKMPRADLPTGPAKAPVNTGRPIQRGGVGGIKQIDSSSNQIIPNVSAATSQTGQPAQPSLRKQREIELQNMAGKTINVGPEGLKSNRPRNAQDAVVQPSLTRLKRPTTDKGSDQMSIGGVGGGNVQPTSTVTNGVEPKVNKTSSEKNTDVSQMIGNTTASEERTKRINETASQVQESARGTIPQAAVIPGVSEEAGTAVKEEMPQEVTTMVEPTEAKAEEAKPVTPETITTGEVKEAPTPETITAAEITKDKLDIVPEETKVDAAEGAIDEDKALAEAAKVDRVAPIEGAKVEIPTGALTERVVGTLSEDAKSKAVQNAGTSLRRITRAKKQLSKAGLSDVEITEIGNDPEILEEKLEDFSEEQRGIIEGLPEEALVSTQINGLLTGIEDGEIPVWARPAVASVESMLAKRGLSASSVGRDALVNTIIQAAMPIAQSNAQAIQSSVAQQKDIEFKESEANTQRKQQTALDKANKVFQMDMAQFNSDQQIALSNSKFLQTVGLTEANNDQQAVIQDALLMSQANLTEADFYQKTQIQNAQAFLGMDMTNLNNKQQSTVLKSQQEQQRILSNQAAQNAAAQFNATSENQTEQFMTSLTAQMNQYNASQMNAMEQFNSTQENAAEARRSAREVDVEKFNAQLITQVDQFNSQQDFTRNQWNAQNSAAVEASNVQWRRQANTVNTAAQNQINMQNAMNAFGLSTQSLSFLWQELRDQADFDFRSFENEENRKAQIIATAIANEGKPGEKYDDYLTSLLTTLGASYSAGLSSGGNSGGGYGGGTSIF